MTDIEKPVTDTELEEDEKGTNPNLPRPAPPVVGKVTHHSIELYWDESLEKAMAVCDKSEGRVRVCLQEHDRSGEWGNLYSPQTSCRTKRQLKCFWKNEKMRAKEELISIWKTNGCRQSQVLPEELTDLSRAVFMMIPDKIKTLAVNSYSGEAGSGSIDSEILIKEELDGEDDDSLEETTESCSEFPVRSVPVPAALDRPDDIQPTRLNDGNHISSYETFLRDIAQKEHDKKMEIYLLKQEILLLKKRKLEAELKNQEDLDSLHGCVQKKRKFEHILDKT